MYWGKVIGALLGTATLKPWLALLGLIVGHQFDRGFTRRYRAFDDAGARSGQLPEAFTVALFQCIGHLAKVDGRVTEEEIRAARRVMQRLHLSPGAVRLAIAHFEQGKAGSFPLLQTVRNLRKSALPHRDHRQLFVRLLLEVGLSKPRMLAAERKLLWQICSELDIGRAELAQLEARQRAQKRRSPTGQDADRERVSAAYRVLGVRPDSSNDEIKRAYRRLMNRNHPDKIAAGNPDAEALARAEQRTREVRRAYELLRARRTIR